MKSRHDEMVIIQLLRQYRDINNTILVRHTDEISLLSEVIGYLYFPPLFASKPILVEYYRVNVGKYLILNVRNKVPEILSM